MLNFYNKVYVLGDVVEIENKQTNKGLPVTRIIIETKYKDSSDHIPCSFYGDMATDVWSTKKGDKLFVVGRLTWQLTETKKVSGVIAEQVFLNE